MRTESTKSPESELGAASAFRLLAKRPGRALLTAFLVLLSIPLATILVGAFVFGGSVYWQIGVHFKSAFGEDSRRSVLSPILIILLALTALVVAGGWVGLVDIAANGHGLASAQQLSLALVTLPLPYAVAAWVVAPVSYLLVLLVDPSAPKSLRHLIPLALRVASEVSFAKRLAAVALSGLVLVGPLSLSALSASSAMHVHLDASSSAVSCQSRSSFPLRARSSLPTTRIFVTTWIATKGAFLTSPPGFFFSASAPLG